MKPEEIDWTVSDAEERRLARIAARASVMFRMIPTDVMMDLIATHKYIVALDLERLADADDDILAHDVKGIGRHLDRHTVTMRDHFEPKCTLKSREANTP